MERILENCKLTKEIIQTAITLQIFLFIGSTEINGSSSLQQPDIVSQIVNYKPKCK